jgi:heterodisulfide reductase subunit B2
VTKYAYFPGCSAHSTGISQTRSVEYVAPRLDIELEEIPDWNCCGTSAARLTDRYLALALPARSLALSEREIPGADVFAPCAGCFQSLKTTLKFSQENEENRATVERLIGMPYQAQADVLNVLDVFGSDEAKSALEDRLVKRFDGLKMACYYGCALVRPESICNPDDTDNPQTMEEIVKVVGGEPVDWPFKTECCGASNHITIPEAAKDMSRRIIEDAAANGADIIVTACPLCWMNLDMREDEINRRFDTEFDIPVYYLTEIIGAALGGTAAEIGIDRHFRPATRLLDHLVGPDAQTAGKEAAL